VKRYKIAIIHPEIWFGGGAESRPPRIIEALKKDYDITLITAGLITNGEVDIDKINAYYGTQISSKDFRLIHFRFPFFLNKTARFSTLKKMLFQRFLKRIVSQYDIVISTSSYTPVDIGVPIIRFIVAFDFDRALCDKLEPPPEYDKPGLQWHVKLFEKLYLWSIRRIFHTDTKAWLKDLIVANSDWTGNILTQHYGCVVQTLYPPVWTELYSIPFDKRENGFVWIGTFAPQKEVETTIEILEKVRARGHNIHLHIIGWGYSDRYIKMIKDIQLQHSAWVFLEGRCGVEKKVKIIAEHRYGINSRKKEPFGISVAEMVKGGCVVFCPNDGGQVEIVGDERVIYNGKEDAVEKICHVLEEQSLQKEILNNLSQRARRFSVKAFQSGVQEIIREYLAKYKSVIEGYDKHSSSLQ